MADDLDAKEVMDVTNEIEEVSCLYINNYCLQIEMSMGPQTFIFFKVRSQFYVVTLGQNSI